MVLKEPTCLCVPDTLIIGLNQMKHKAQHQAHAPNNSKPNHKANETQAHIKIKLKLPQQVL